MANVVPGNTSSAKGLYSLQPLDPSQANTTGLADPFNMASEGGVNDNGYNELSSPGYQQYGQTWLNLLNSLGQTQQPGELGNTQVAQQATNPDTAGAQSQINMLQAKYGNAVPSTWGNVTDQNQLAQLQSQLDPIGSTQGGATTGLANKILNDYSSNGDFNAASAEAAPAIDKTFGLDPSDPQSQQYSNALVTDILQGQQYDQYHNFLTDTKHDEFSLINGEVAKTFASIAAQGAFGPLGGLSSVGEAATEAALETGSTAAEAATDATLVGDIGTLYGTAQGGAGLINGIESGSPVDAIGGALSLASGINKIGDPFSTPEGNLPTASTSDFGVSSNSDNGTFPADQNPTGGQTGTAYPDVTAELSPTNLVPPSSLSSPSSNTGQKQGDNSSIQNLIGGASGANQLTGVLQGLLGQDNPAVAGNTTTNGTYGTNQITTPVSQAEANTVDQTGSFVDRQYYDIVDQIKQKYSKIGQSGSQQEQQEIQQAIQQQAG